MTTQDLLGLVDLPESAYHAHPAISKSGLDRVAVSPLHFKAWKEAPPEPSEAMIFGTACHRLILEPERFEASVACAPDLDRRTKDGKAGWEAFCAQNDGKLVLKRDQYDCLRGMAEAWKAHPLSKGVHTQAKHEPSAFWKDPGTGILCKARPDIIHQNGMVLDLKTTESALPGEFQRTIAKYRYHVQAAWYLDGVTRATGVEFDQFLFIVIEKKPPFGIAVYVATAPMIAAGRQAYMKDFQTYAECVRSDQWPSYPTDVQPIDLPAWAVV